ncbi:hypothetical protein NDU88_002830 [Pleurodeles waltl]|uniref:Uncharacterized protein n=1 Tax=Pleurodeles waltl TaxID=8319 RepID=A0AAV7LL95_PLEWA|nr:hypothetical protein NDU88_002830 [Pleurodeles waltl]
MFFWPHTPASGCRPFTLKDAPQASPQTSPSQLYIRPPRADRTADQWPALLHAPKLRQHSALQPRHSFALQPRHSFARSPLSLGPLSSRPTRRALLLSIPAPSTALGPTAGSSHRKLTALQKCAAALLRPARGSPGSRPTAR